jgi:hypothetical protein
MNPIQHPHYHWVWEPTFHGGKNISIYENRTHIVTCFSEKSAKRIITVLKSHSTVSGQPQQDISAITMDILKRFGEQPEFKEAWKNLPNAERNYLCGDIYNIVARSRPVHQQQEQAVRDLDKLVKWLYSEGIKFEKMCDSEENYITAASACARRAQCYYTIEKIAELRQSAKEPVQEGRAPGDER